MDDTLFQAAHILDQRGWARGRMQEKDGSVCMAGAIQAAQEQEGQKFSWCSSSMERLGKLLHSRVAGDINVVSYNDKLAESKEECVKLLMEAAEVEL